MCFFYCVFKCFHHFCHLYLLSLLLHFFILYFLEVHFRLSLRWHFASSSSLSSLFFSRFFFQIKLFLLFSVTLATSFYYKRCSLFNFLTNFSTGFSSLYSNPFLFSNVFFLSPSSSVPSFHFSHLDFISFLFSLPQYFLKWCLPFHLL